MYEVVLPLAITIWLLYFKVGCGGFSKRIPSPHWKIFDYIEYIHIVCFWVGYFIMSGIPMGWLRGLCRDMGSDWCRIDYSGLCCGHIE